MAFVLETDRESGRNPNDPNYFALAMWQARKREVINISQSGNPHDKIENFIFSTTNVTFDSNQKKCLGGYHMQDENGR